MICCSSASKMNPMAKPSSLDAPTAVPHYDVDLFSDAAIEDPFPHYAAIRALGPVVWLPSNDIYAVGRFDEVTQVLRSPTLFSSSRGLSLQSKVNDILVGSTLNSDPPEHDLTRSVTSAPLLPGALEQHTAAIALAADKLIDRLAERGHFDAIEDLARYLPVTIVAELVGLPDAGRDRLLDWASATFNLFGPDNKRSRAAFADLQSLREFLTAHGRPEQLKPGGWAKQIFQTGPQRGISLEACAQLMRDYINPSLDTTISATGQAIWFFAQHPDQWEKVRTDPSLIPNAIEEIVRLATPIRAFSRYVTQQTELAGSVLPADARVLAIYASANRDERKYPEPDRFDVTRDVHDHVGFGHGLHMCMGMHLARLEMTCLLSALTRRVKRFELTAQPTIAMNNTIRAFATLPVKVELTDQAINTHPGKPKNVPIEHVVAGHWLDVTVTERRPQTDSIVELTFTSATDTALPDYQAGAHIDLEVAPGLVRQYSLNSPNPMPGRYRIAVLREPQGQVSPLVHQRLQTGSRARISRPRNHFPVNETASRSLLFAGGIGITPLLAMAGRLQLLDRSFHLYYRIRSNKQIAFADELAALAPNVTLSVSDSEPTDGFSYAAALDGMTSTDHLYACGPERYMTFVCESAQEAGWSDAQVHTEHFGAEIDTSGDPFEVVCERSGIKVQVQVGQTIANQLIEAGINVPMSCQSGVCGTCLTPVLQGRPDHRDLVQTDAEKANNTKITVCCSRSLTRQLVLDL